MVKKFLQHVVPGVVRPMRILWNEIIAFLFFCLAVVSIFNLIKALRAFDGDSESLFRVTLTGLFGAVMLYFGITSWWRARKISRS